ncbi:hypothetical protein TrVE_jg4108 [Triparma verrucosa]|uniref:Uncharacterized protein n=1 Tax=Triparma verrucosa TaxID=1606542 RepID=A0A9W7CET5_9STRA|nr:hypothetical protein TrVE_jg4108 [Triparma verrucosa]
MHAPLETEKSDSNSYPAEKSVEVQDCGCYDRLCGCCCCKNDGCLCGFGQRSKCVKFCCLPFTLVLLGLSLYFFLPVHPIEVVIDSDLFKEYIDPRSSYYDQFGCDEYPDQYDPDDPNPQYLKSDCINFQWNRFNKFEWDIAEKSLTFQFVIPTLTTNYNWMYSVDFDAKGQVYYPGDLPDPVNDAVYLGGAGAGKFSYYGQTIGANPRLMCYLNFDCTGDPVEDGWKSQEVLVWASAEFVADSEQWSQIFNAVEADCGACKDPDHDCIETTPMFLHIEVTPNEQGMSNLNSMVGTIVLEEVEEVPCEGFYSASVLGL